MAQKWIINDDRFKMSAAVEFHKDLATDHSTTKGGGLWSLDQEKKILYLWGVSSDYGYSDPEVVEKAFSTGLVPSRFDGYKVMKSPIISQTMPSLESFETICTIQS